MKKGGGGERQEREWDSTMTRTVLQCSTETGLPPRQAPPTEACPPGAFVRCPVAERVVLRFTCAPLCPPMAAEVERVCDNEAVSRNRL